MTEHNAVTFNPTGFRTWLDAPINTGSAVTNRDAVSVLGTAWQRLNGEGGWMVEAVLDALRDQPGVWAYGPDAGDVRVWAIADPEGFPDGGLIGEITVDGVALSLGRMTENNLVPDEYDVLPGYVAAEQALTCLALRANNTVRHFRDYVEEITGGEVVDAEIVDDNRSAYGRAADAVDNDANNPAHPAHW